MLSSYRSVLHLRNSCSNVADLADLYNMPSAFHDSASPLGLTASAQLFGAVRNLRTMAIPYHADQVPWRWEVIASPQALIEEGLFKVPLGPGLGIELNEKVVRAHLRPGCSYFDEGS